MPANGQVRFGGGPEEKGDKPYLACGLPNTNLTDAVERVLNNRQPHVREAASAVIKSQTSLASAVINAGPTTMLSSRSERESEQNREKRYARYLQVIKLRKQGLAMHIIARSLKMSRMTVRRYIEADGFPERAPTRTRHSRLEKYVPYRVPSAIVP